MIEKKCYFYNIGTIFNKDDKEELHNCWSCNSNCCKSDLCNGLYCEDYGIDFNKEKTIDQVLEYVKSGVNGTYGFIKEVKIYLTDEEWNCIYNTLVNDRDFTNIIDAKNNGYIPFDYYEIIDDFSSYWEEPDFSFLKDKNNIKQNVIHIFKESELNPDTINWINENIYQISKKNTDILI